jgi:hypothetical protein
VTTIQSGRRLNDRSLNFVSGRISPREDWLIIKPLPPHLSQTLHAEWNGEAVRGEVVAAGPGKYPNVHKRGFRPGKDGKPVEFREVRKSRCFVPTQVKVGDIVQLGGMDVGGYLWKHIIVDGVDMVWCMEADVTFIEGYDA